jgi:hypothetical protein
LEQGFAMDDELPGDGTIILDGESVATVYYWLTVVHGRGFDFWVRGRDEKDQQSHRSTTGSR